MAGRISTYVKQHHLALLCLFLVVGGGTAWALERNSVKSRHIVNGQVRAGDLADNGVTGTKVEDGSLALGDIVRSAELTTWGTGPVAAGDCKFIDLLGGQSFPADADAALVLPARNAGSTVEWDPRFILDGYGATGGDNPTFELYGPSVRVCNISNDDVENTTLPFYIMSLMR